MYNAGYLMHHGILGQKWGKRNGPPYPLKEGSHTLVEKTGQGKNQADKILNAYGNKKMAGMDPVTAVYATYVAAFAVSIAVNKIRYKNEIKKNTSENQGDIQKKIKGRHSEADDLKAVNPDYVDPTDMGARANCTMCSTAYELRRRGYDVVAQKSVLGRKPKDAAKWFGIEKKDINSFKTRDDFAKALENEPDGARGLTFTAYGQFGSHHSMIWEKKNGQILISDG